MSSMIRKFHSTAFGLKDVARFIEKSGNVPKMNGSATIYNPKSSASNYKGYMRAKIPTGLYYNPAPSTVHGSINSETIPKSFMSQNDPRRRIVDELASSDKEVSKVAPSLHNKGEKTYHLTPKEIEEIKALRSSDPVKYSRSALAKKYNCSRLFISIVSESPKARKEQMMNTLETIKGSWHPKRALAREERKKRKQLWYRA